MSKNCFDLFSHNAIIILNERVVVDEFVFIFISVKRHR